MVVVGERRITDIGTKFVIRRDESRMKVAVLEGQVELATAGSQAGRAASSSIPGDVAVATGNTVAISRKTRRILTNELGWQRGVLIFDNVTLAEAAAEFNRYNREKIVIADPSAAQITIGATLPQNDVPAFARVAKTIFGLHVERQGDMIVIHIDRKRHGSGNMTGNSEDTQIATAVRHKHGASDNDRHRTGFPNPRRRHARCACRLHETIGCFADVSERGR